MTDPREPLRKVVTSELWWSQGDPQRRGYHYREERLECGHSLIPSGLRKSKRRRCKECVRQKENEHER